MNQWLPKVDMRGKVLLIILVFASGAYASAEVSRKGAKAQSEDAKRNISLRSYFAPLRLCVSNDLGNDLAIEVFQVLELPLSVHEASLTKSGKEYLLKLSLGNSSDLKLIGLRYSLATIDSANHTGALISMTEGFSIPAYDTKSLTFRTPIRFKPKDGERLVLMVEQVISPESIWEVMKAKEAFASYVKGDYSVMPAVMRMPNQVDAPHPGGPRVIFDK